MKRVYYILFCLLSCAAMAQTPGVLMHTANVGFDDIIRHDPTTGLHITYSMVPGLQNHFAITDYSVEKDCMVSCSLLVKDFEIINDYVFFCGSTLSNTGFLGWFGISQLFASAGPAYVDPNLVVGDMATLEDIEVFRDDAGLIHVAGYGIDYGSSGSGNLIRAFEAVGNPTSVMRYRTLRLDNQLFQDQIVDMVVTDNYVTYLGKVVNPDLTFSAPFGMELTFHTFPKFDMFGSSPYPVHMFQTAMYGEMGLYVIPHNHDPIHLSNPKMTHYKKDQVAVCTYREDLTWGLGPTGIHSNTVASYLANRIFDLSPLAGGGQISSISVAFADLPSEVGGAINDFVYDSASGHFVVLHNFSTPTVPTDYYVTTLDYSTGVPPATVEYECQSAYATPGVWVPSSLCLDPSGKYSVMGHANGQMEHYYWQNAIVRNLGWCTVMGDFPMAPASLEEAKVRYVDSMPTSWFSLNFLAQPLANVSEQPVNIICN